MKKILLFCLSMACCAGMAQTVDRYVSGTGGNQPPFTNWNMAATSLKAAVDWANTNNAGDTVWVSNGLYVLPATVYVSNVVVRGADGNREHVVISGNNAVRCFVLRHPNAELNSLTVSNGSRAGSSTDGGGGVCIFTGSLVNAVVGWSKANYGGGVFCYGQAWISNCWIMANTSVVPGGGIYFDVTGTNVITMQDCHIIGNCATHESSGVGGGVAIQGASLTRATLSKCLIANNSAQVQGGGIGFYNTGCGTIRDCSIVSNVSFGTGGGGGIYGTRHVAVLNCLVRANTSGGNGGGISYSSYDSSYTGHIFGCTMDNNLGGTGGNGAGGIYFSGMGGVSNSVITNNSGTHGSGARLQNGATMRSCLIAANTSGMGALYLAQTSTVENCTIIANTLQVSGGMRMAVTNFQILRNCIIYDNWLTNGTKADVSLATDGEKYIFNSCVGTTVLPPDQGDITNNPLFLAADNYRLQENSPCVNTGTNLEWMAGALELDGRPRQDRFSRKVDMGAYEHLPEGVLFFGR